MTSALITRRNGLGMAVALALWIALTGSLSPQELVAGVIVAALVTLLAQRQLALLDAVRVSPALPWHVARFLGVFLWALVKANLDMARRILSPRLPVDPAMVEVQTGLRSTLGRLLLANSITLTPGTLTVDVLEDRLRVHWIDVTPGQDLASATEAIASRFERHIEAFLS